MILFTLAASLTYALLFAFGMITGWESLRHDGRTWAEYAALLIVLPGVATYLGAEVGHLLRPRRAFHPRAAAAVGLCLAGFGSGLLGLVMITGLVLAQVGVPDFAICIAAGFAASVLLVMTLARSHAGHCGLCDYDLRGSPDGRCPECGTRELAAIPQDQPGLNAATEY